MPGCRRPACLLPADDTPEGQIPHQTGILPPIKGQSCGRMNLSNEVYEAGKEICAARPPDLEDAFNSVLNRFLGDQFRSAPGRIVDRTGKRSERFACVVRRTEQYADPPGPDFFPADAAAAVVDVSEELTRESLRASCRRIADAKSLRKSPVVPGRNPRSNITLGIVFAVSTGLPLETVGQEFDRVSSEIPSAQWTDMVVVATTGVINFAVQFPGEFVSADFLPPAEGALANYIPAIYVVPVMRPTGAYAFNKMLAFLIAHLSVFAPDVQFPDWSKISGERLPERRNARRLSVQSARRTRASAPWTI